MTIRKARQPRRTRNPIKSPGNAARGYPVPGANDQLFHVLMATAVDGIVVIDAQGTIQAFNPACERLFGYAPGEVIGRNVKMLMPAPYRTKHDGYLSHYSRTGEKRIIGIGREVVGQHKNLSTFPMYLSVGEGDLDGRKLFVGIIHDLSAIRAEIAHRGDSDRLLAQTVQSSDDAIISKTLGGVIMTWNSAAERIFGYSAAEAIGQPISIVIPPDLIAEEARVMARLRKGGSIQNYETARRHKDGGEVLVSLSRAPIRDGAGKIIGLSMIARDISEKKRAETHAKEQENDLAHMGRLGAMGQMSAAIAHELNQPLTAIVNYVKAAQRLLEPQGLCPNHIETARGAMDKAAGQAARAGSIIRYLREFVEKRASEKTPENLNAIIREALALAFVGTAQSSMKIKLDLAPRLPVVVMDKVQIQQVLVNLVRNSIEAMAGVEPRELKVSSAREGKECVCITIHDTGPGLSPDVLNKLFQPFVTTKAKGMGIGLNICQAIVEAHGGRIRALPDVKPGATFEVRLPWVQVTHEAQSDHQDGPA